MTTVAEATLTEKYCTRLDQHVEGLEPERRLPFLKDQRNQWLEDYGFFCRLVDGGHEAWPGVTATDYVLTIVEIGARIAKLEAAQ